VIQAVSLALVGEAAGLGDPDARAAGLAAALPVPAADGALVGDVPVEAGDGVAASSAFGK
jgi:hypothetical protein